MVITRANPSTDTDPGSDAQGNAGDHLADIHAPIPDLTLRMEQLTNLVERLIARDADRSRQEDQVVQTATALTQMTEAVTHLAKVTYERGTNGAGLEDDDDTADGTDDPETPVAEIIAADPRFQPLFKLETYRLTNRKTRVTSRGVSRLTKRAGEIRPRMTKSFSGRDILEIIPFLSRLREVSDEAGLSEGMLLRIIPDLLVEPSLTAFRSVHPRSYPGALRWFLLTYAPESTVADYWRRLQQSRQKESETPNEYALRLQLEAAKLGSIIPSQELKALFEDGLVDATRYLLRATINTDPNRTLTDSVTTASALAKALSSKAPEPTFRTDVARLRARRVMLAEPDETKMDDWLEKKNNPDEDAEDLLVCYGDHEDRRQFSRIESPEHRLCWTCWLPGHFSEECPVVPEHLRPEIAGRKKKALTMLRQQRAERPGGSQPGWYQPRSSRPAVRDSKTIAVAEQVPETAAIAKNEEGGEPSSH